MSDQSILIQLKNEILAALLLVVFTIIIIVIVFKMTELARISFGKSQYGTAKSFTYLMRRSGALQISTVSFIIVVVGVCTIIGKIDSTALISIMSGIAGYVLGGLDSSGGHNSPEKPKSKNDHNGGPEK